MVRLRAWEFSLRRRFQQNFNSNMVRLRDSLMLLVPNILSKFQFQYGAIKRNASGVIIGGGSGFQFQYGAIKSRSTTHKKYLKISELRFADRSKTVS